MQQLRNLIVIGLLSKVFSRLSKSRATGGTIRRCYSGISCPPPGLAVEELKNRHGFGPWLMFADAENDKRDPTGGGFRQCYSFASGEVFSLPAPQLQGRRCWGTRYGWLITYAADGDVHLFNPLTHHQLPLPSRLTLKQLPPDEIERDDQISFFDLFSLSSDSNRLVVTSMYGLDTQLAFSSPGDEAWKYKPETPADWDMDIANMDTIFYRGQFYSIDCGGKLKVCDITSGEPEEKLISTFRAGFLGKYLVEISGQLHLICPTYVRGADICGGRYTTLKTKCFVIYRFDFQENNWISIEDLNGHALFVGNNTPFAISATDYPGIKPNCIYFTDDHAQDYGHPFCDMGVYDFATKTLVEPVPFIKGDNLPYSKYSRPNFFIPSL